MAARKSYHLYFGSSEKNNPITRESQFEFDESEVWTSGELLHNPDPPQDKRPSTLPNSLRPLKRPTKRGGGAKNEASVAAASFPVNIPDWSTILGDEYKAHRKESDDDDHEDDEYGRLPPHEYLARTRGSSLSVHEGIGRTLKGRDLSRVRDAVWKHIGFED